MKNKKISIAGICILFAFFWRVQVVCAREFVHPGGLHTRADLERMKKMVAEGRQPWLEGWRKTLWRNILSSRRRWRIWA